MSNTLKPFDYTAPTENLKASGRYGHKMQEMVIRKSIEIPYVPRRNDVNKMRYSDPIELENYFKPENRGILVKLPKPKLPLISTREYKRKNNQVDISVFEPKKAKPLRIKAENRSSRRDDQSTVKYYSEVDRVPKSSLLAIESDIGTIRPDYSGRADHTMAPRSELPLSIREKESDFDDYNMSSNQTEKTRIVQKFKYPTNIIQK